MMSRHSNADVASICRKRNRMLIYVVVVLFFCLFHMAFGTDLKVQMGYFTSLLKFHHPSSTNTVNSIDMLTEWEFLKVSYSIYQVQIRKQSIGITSFHAMNLEQFHAHNFSQKCSME